MAEHCTSFKDMLRSKNFLIVVLFIVATSISIWLLSLPTPNLRNIMTQTHKQIESQIENLKNMNIENFKNINVITRNEQYEERELTLDETYLELLGFTQSPHLYPEYVHPVKPIPVVVTGATNKNYRTTIGLISSAKKHLDGKEVVVFDLGMGSYELVSLKKHCNVTYNCSVRSLDFDKFPKHLKNKSMRAYLPILIQTALIEYASIIWTSSDTDEQFILSSVTSDVLARANETGIVAWTIESMEPTSAYTHPKMFDYFQMDQEEYYFHRMVSTDHLVIYNTRDIHEKLMLPWVQCALTVECISPKGAQSVGCNRQRKPKYLYSGCHKFEVSALNVILGNMFDLMDDLYITNDLIFGLEYEFTTTVPYSKTIQKSNVSSKKSKLRPKTVL